MSSSFKSLIILFFFLYAGELLAQAVVIPFGSEWTYYDKGNEPADNDGLKWYDIGYDDNSWSQGKAQLGYGDNDEKTMVNSDILTLYVRKSFTLEDANERERITLDLIYDDGAVIYFNGRELRRENMPAGNISYNTTASSVGEENGEKAFFLNEVLIEGENVIAVEIHQESATSSDISFDLRLSRQISDKTPFTSNLPIVYINTEDGLGIVDEPKKGAQMRIIYDENGGQNTSDNDVFHYEGRIGIELRGQSSLFLFPKKGMGFETWDENDEDKNESFLGFPEESDWVIHSPYSDKTLMRNVLAYKMGGDIMSYAPRVKLAELIINDFYYGVVVFTEKIKRDKNRVDVNRLREDENEGDDLTGGYILKWDKGEPEEVGWASKYRPIPGRSGVTEYLYHYPKPEDITPQQQTYIKRWIDNVEDVLKSANFNDPSQGYRKYLDVNSFIDMMIINEISKNVDGYRLSTYFSKQKDSDGGKLSMGPIWDYNLAFGNANYCEGGETWGWAHQFNTVCPGDRWTIAFWWDKLLSDESYRQQFKDRYQYLRKDKFSNEKVLSMVDSVVAHVGESIDRESLTWRNIGEEIWPNNFVGETYEDEINELKRWLTERFRWLDQNIQALTTNVVDISKSDVVSVFPNPVQDNLYIQASSIQFERVRIFSMDGKLVDDRPFSERFNLGHIGSKGIHILQIIDADGKVYVDKIDIR